MRRINATQKGHPSNRIPAARVDARYAPVSFHAAACWTGPLADLDPVTMGFHRSRHLRRPSP